MQTCNDAGFELAFSDNLTTIEESAFLGNKLNRVTFGTGIESIASWAFAENSSLNRVMFRGSPPVSIDPGGNEGASLGNAEGLVVLFPRELAKHYLADDIDPNRWQSYAASPSELRVNFNSHGSTAIPGEHIEYGRLLSLPQQPTKRGAVFIGWFRDPQLTMKFDAATPLTTDLTLHAGWKSITAPATGVGKDSAPSAHDGLARTGDVRNGITAFAIGAVVLLAAGAACVTRDRQRTRLRR